MQCYFFCYGRGARANSWPLSLAPNAVVVIPCGIIVVFGLRSSIGDLGGVLFVSLFARVRCELCSLWLRVYTHFVFRPGVKPRKLNHTLTGHCPLGDLNERARIHTSPFTHLSQCYLHPFYTPLSAHPHKQAAHKHKKPKRKNTTRSGVEPARSCSFKLPADRSTD